MKFITEGSPKRPSLTNEPPKALARSRVPLRPPRGLAKIVAPTWGPNSAAQKYGSFEEKGLERSFGKESGLEQSFAGKHWHRGSNHNSSNYFARRYMGVSQNWEPLQVYVSKYMGVSQRWGTPPGIPCLLLLHWFPFGFPFKLFKKGSL